MIAPAFNQIAMNQTAFTNQLAAMSMMQQPQQAAMIAPTQQFSTPPIPNVAFPMQHPFPVPYPKTGAIPATVQAAQSGIS
jgi:hypothetical protein